MSQPSETPPLLEHQSVRIFPNSIQSAMGIYDPRSVDGVEFGPARVPLEDMVNDVIRAVALSSLWLAFVNAIPAAVFAGALIFDVIGWWRKRQQFAATILVRGVRVELIVTDATGARHIANAVLQAAEGSR